MLYGKKGAGVKAGTQQSTRPGQRPDWRFRLVQKQRQGAERAATSTLNGEFYAAHAVDANAAIKRHAEFASQPEPQPVRRHRRPSAPPLKTHVVQRDGQSFEVQTSTPRILRPATPGMCAMIAVLLTSENEEVREAA
jgi:hypothetical protein